MTNLQFLTTLAAAADGKLNKRVALILYNDSLRVEAVGVHTGDGGYQTAIVNAVQNLNKNLDSFYVVATYQPTPMCEGMCKGRVLSGMTFVTGGRIGTPTDNPAIASSTLRIGKADNSPLETAPALSGAVAWFDGLDTRNLTEVAGNAVASLRRVLRDGTAVYSSRYMPDNIRDLYTLTPTVPPVILQQDEEEQIYMRLAYALVGQSWTELTAWTPGTNKDQEMGGTNIGAVTVYQGKIIAWGLNSLAQNKTYHAETVMLGAYLAKNNVSAMPSGVHIYTTLQPCRMCAGFIVRVCPNARVYYGLRDQQLSTILTAGATNGCKEVAVTTKFKSINEQQGRLNSLGGTQTPQFLAQKSESNTFVQYGQAILNRRTDVIKQIDALEKELAKLGAAPTGPPKPVNWAKAADPTTPEAKRKALTASIAGLDKTLKALEQCIGLLKIVGEQGLTTTYGWSVLEALFPQLKAS